MGLDLTPAFSRHAGSTARGSRATGMSPPLRSIDDGFTIRRTVGERLSVALNERVAAARTPSARRHLGSRA
ncbi:MAG: hypothetical protein ACRYGP_07935 [Janthinobacterium lividum]